MLTAKVYPTPMQGARTDLKRTSGEKPEVEGIDPPLLAKCRKILYHAPAYADLVIARRLIESQSSRRSAASAGR